VSKGRSRIVKFEQTMPRPSRSALASNARQAVGNGVVVAEGNLPTLQDMMKTIGEDGCLYVIRIDEPNLKLGQSVPATSFDWSA
jgi:hypothetical protein